MVTSLNLPPFEAKIIRDTDGEKIYDILRQKYVALTPEEWVRQHFVNYLINQKGYPRGLMANEYHLTLNGVSRRCDTIVFDRCCRPLAIVEYKAPTVSVTQKVFDQIASYNMALNAGFLMVSNGMRHFCCSLDYAARSYAFLKEIPNYEVLISLYEEKKD